MARTIELKTQAREQFIRLIPRTDIGQQNILCRWAFCLSLRQPSPPTPVEIPADSNAELTWQVFGSATHELYLAPLTERGERTGWAQQTRCWGGSSVSPSTAASPTWPRRTPSAPSPT